MRQIMKKILLDFLYVRILIFWLLRSLNLFGYDVNIRCKMWNDDGRDDDDDDDAGWWWCHCDGNVMVWWGGEAVPQPHLWASCLCVHPKAASGCHCHPACGWEASVCLSGVKCLVWWSCVCVLQLPQSWCAAPAAAAAAAWSHTSRPVLGVTCRRAARFSVRELNALWYWQQSQETR